MNAPTAFPDPKPVPPYKHTPLFPLGADTAPYKKITAEGVRVEKVLGKDMLVVSREALRALSEAAFGDINHYLRPGHLQQLRNILDDAEASDNRIVEDFLPSPDRLSVLSGAQVAEVRRRRADPNRKPVSHAEARERITRAGREGVRRFDVPEE